MSKILREFNQAAIETEQNIRAICNSLRAENKTLKQDLFKAKELLRELHALAKGECPRLLDDDRGGNAELAMQIEEFLE